MKKALEATQNGMSIRKASACYNVPRSTLSDKIAGKTQVVRKIGPNSVLTSEEENHLVSWIFNAAKAGFPVTTSQLFESVQLLIHELKRENPFVDDKPGRHWYESFFRRHPEISKRVPQSLTGQRTSDRRKNTPMVR